MGLATMPLAATSTVGQEAASDQNQLVIRTIEAGTGQTVRSVIWFRSLQVDEKDIGQTDDKGVFNYGRIACRPDMGFKAAPMADIRYLSVNEWKQCATGELVFVFSLNAYAANIDAVLSYASLLATGTAGGSEKLTVLGAKLTEAWASGAYGDLPALATELKFALMVQGESGLANDAAILAYAATSTALGVQDDLVFDVQQETFVMSPYTVDAIKAFQTSSSLTASGNLDWATMELISTSLGNGQAQWWIKKASQ